MRRAKSGRTTRLVAVAVTLVMIAAACGSGDESGDQVDGGASVSESAASDAGGSPGPETDPVAAAGSQAEQPEEQAAAESPAAEADAERQPAVWTEAVIGTVDISPGRSGLWTIGDEIWFTTGRWSSSFVARSGDRGMTFDEVVVERPPAAGLAYQSSTVDGLVSDGSTIVGWGRRGRRCTVVAMDGPFDDVVSCSRQGAVIHRSTDSGMTWEQFEPPAMVLGDSNVVLAGVVAVEGGFVAAGTVQGTDWHGRVWVSPDGASWTLARELRGVGAAMSIYGIASDGETLVVEAAEHVCVVGGVQGGSNRVSWSLGTGFASDVRLFVGAAAESLELVDEGDVPFVPAPREIDCASTSSFSLAQEPYPNVLVATVDGRIVVVDTSAFPDVESTDDGPALSPRRWATLADGEWQEVSVPDVIRPVTNALDYRLAARFLLPDETGMGLYEAARAGRDTGLRQPRPVRFVGGEYQQVELPVVAAWKDLAATSVDGALLVVSLVVADPFLRSRVSNDPAEVVVFRYDDPPALASCDLVAGGSCRFARLDLVAGYPDFAGRDLAGIDLSWADLGEANFDGAVLDGAVLIGARADGASFEGASLRSADLRTAELGDVGGADFTDADLAGAELRAATQPILDGAVLTNLDLLSSRGDDDSAPLVLSLVGLDLSGVSIDRPLDGRPIIIADLTGAIVDDRTRFSGVDMTDTVLGDVDITVPSVLDDSICPGGLAPVGGYIGNCPPSG